MLWAYNHCEYWATKAALITLASAHAALRSPGGDASLTCAVRCTATASSCRKAWPPS